MFQVLLSWTVWNKILKQYDENSVAFYACEVSSEIGTERVNKRIVNTAFKNSERIYAVIKIQFQQTWKLGPKCVWKVQVVFGIVDDVANNNCLNKKY
jgi:hypothetical protein